MVLALGILSLFTMPRGEDPTFSAPSFVIVAVYPGTSPNDMEKMVADPIEERLNELSEVKRIKTDINDGLCVVLIDFKYDSDIDNKYNEVVRELNSLRSKLPADLLSLEARKVTASDVNTYQLALVSETESFPKMNDYAEKLKKQLEAIKEVKKVKITGVPEEQVNISVDLEKMAQNKVSLNRVLGSLQSEAANIPGGSIDAGGMKFNIKTSGDYADMDEIRNTVVSTSGARLVYLKDVATVEMGTEEVATKARFNGKRAVFISISEKEQTNIMQVNEKVVPVLTSFEKSLPKSMKLDRGFVQADDVGDRLGHFGRDFIIAILLVLITLLPLGTRASIVVMISIPLSISIGLFMLNALGYTINQLSIVGMVIALGLLVDDSIVVVENIERFLRNGYSRREAAIEATKQIGVAVLGCTATLIIAFLPIVFMPEAAGDFIRSLPMAVITTIVASLFVSLTIVPFLSSRILSSNHSAEGNIFLQYLQKAISGSYRQLLNKSLAHPKMTLLIATLLFIGSLGLFGVVGFSLFPKSDKPMFLVNVETPLGTSVETTDSITRIVEAEILKEKDAKAVFANIGTGNPRVYYNVVDVNNKANFSQIFVRLNALELPEIEELVDRLRGKFASVPGAKIEVKQFEQGPPIDAPIAIRLFGEDLDSLRTLATRVEQMMKATEGTIYVGNPLSNYKTDIHLNINKDKAAMLGIPTVEIDKTVRMGIAGLNVATFKDDEGEDYNMNVRVDRDQHQTLELFNKLYVNSMAGASVPVNQLATLEFETSVPTIKHFNKNRFITITAFVKSGYNTKQLTDVVLKKMDAMKLPTGFTYEAAGEVESSKESFGGLETIVLITFFGFLGVLLLEFRTFKSSLIVLSVIPLGVIGAVLTLLLTGNTMSFVAVVGLIALAGIEVKNSILLVDYTNQLREGGMGLDEAIEVAGETRFLPIILTTLTAIGGLVPLVLEHSPLYSPLAWVLIGGLIVSTLLTRLVTPVMYKILAPDVEIEK